MPFFSGVLSLGIISITFVVLLVGLILICNALCCLGSVAFKIADVILTKLRIIGNIQCGSGTDDSTESFEA